MELLQRKEGYRFNLDPILLAHFAMANGLRTPAVDLGTGVGVMPLILARKFGLRNLTAVELQPTLFALAVRNVKLNRCERRVALANGDLRRIRAMFSQRAFQAVLSNPPYRPRSAGHVNPETEKAIARHEVACSLSDVVAAAAWLLGHRGAFHVVYPAARLSFLFAALGNAGLAPRVMRLVHPREGTAAKLVLLTALKVERTELEVQPPLVLHGDEQAYTPEVERMLAGQLSME